MRAKVSMCCFKPECVLTRHVSLVSMTTISWQLLLYDRHCPFMVYYLFIFYFTSRHQSKDDVGAWRYRLGQEKEKELRRHHRRRSEKALLMIEYTNTQFHTVWLCLYVADPATFLASNSAPGPYCPLRTACLFSYGNNKYFWICVIISLIL